jgi:hypothetical protein
MSTQHVEAPARSVGAPASSVRPLPVQKEAAQDGGANTDHRHRPDDDHHQRIPGAPEGPVRRPGSVL